MGILSCLKSAFGHCYDRRHRTSNPVIRHPSRNHHLALDNNKKRELLAHELLKAKQQAKEQEMTPLQNLNPQVVPSVSKMQTEISIPSPAVSCKSYTLEISLKENPPVEIPQATAMEVVPAEKESPSIIERRRQSHLQKNLPTPGEIPPVRTKSLELIPQLDQIVVPHFGLISTSAFVLKYAGIQCFRNDKTPLPKLAKYLELLSGSIDKCSAYLTEEPAWKALPEEAITHAKIHLKERKYKFMTEIEKELNKPPKPEQVVLVANGYNPMVVALAEKYPETKFYVTDKSREACNWNKTAYAKLGLNNILVVNSDCTRENLIHRLEKTSFDAYISSQSKFLLFNRTSPTIFALEGITYYLSEPEEHALLTQCLDIPAPRSVVLMDYKDTDSIRQCEDIKDEQGNSEPYYHNLISTTIEELTGCEPLRTTSYRNISDRLHGYYKENSLKNYEVDYCDMDEDDKANLLHLDHDYDDLRFEAVPMGAEVIKITTKPKDWDEFKPVNQAAPLVSETELNPLPVPDGKLFTLTS